jgi:hypothetical protein
MALADYAGRSPQHEESATVARVSRHHKWSTEGASRSDCAWCGAELDLHEGHVLATLTGGDGRRFLCDETCLREWLGVDGG